MQFDFFALSTTLIDTAKLQLLPDTVSTYVYLCPFMSTYCFLNAVTQYVVLGGLRLRCRFARPLVHETFFRLKVSLRGLNISLKQKTFYTPIYPLNREAITRCLVDLKKTHRSLTCCLVG